MKSIKLNQSKAWAGAALLLCSLNAYSEEPGEVSNINKDQIQGRVEEAKGAVKESTGKVLDDKSMELEGNIQKNLGKAQAGYGDLTKDIKDRK